MTSGIYTIFNTVTEQLYVGKTCNLSRRWLDHKKNLRRGTHGNPILQASWAKHGEESFEFRLVQEIEGPLLNAERAYGDYYAAVGYRLYNLKAFGEGLERHSAASKALMAEKARGRVKSPEERAKLSAAHKGVSRFSEERRAAMSIRMTGQVPSEETRSRISAANKGKKKTPEQVLAMSLARMGKPSHRKGVPMSDETRAKLSAARTGSKGVPWTEESRAKRMAYWASKRDEKTYSVGLTVLDPTR